MAFSHCYWRANAAFHRPGSQFVFSFEQDSVIKPSSDKDYTMGVVFDWRGGWVERSFLARGFRAADVPGRWLQRRLAGTGVHHSFQFGDSAFTPLKSNLGRTDPVHDDRPYANLLFATIKRTSSDKPDLDADVAVVSELTVGILGLGVGRVVQTAIHKAIDDVVPGGWDNQISNGGEPTLRYRTSVRNRLLTVGGPRGWGADTSSAIDLNAGYYTNLSLRGRLRVGRRESSWFDYERVSHTVYLPRRATSLCIRRSKPWELFATLSGGWTGWAYNELLQGGVRHSEVRLGFGKEPAPMRRSVCDWQISVTASILGIALTGTESHHTALFNGPHSRPHRWRTFSVTF